MEDLNLRFGRSFASVSNWYGMSLTLRCVLPLLLSITSISLVRVNSVFEWLGSVVLLGLCGYRIQFVLHEATHNTLFSSRRINDLIANFTGLLVGVSFKKYRTTHLFHHRKNGEVDDPQYFDYLPQSGLTRAQYLKFLIGPLVGSRIRTYLRREIFSSSTRNTTLKNPRISWGWFASLGLVQIIIILCVSHGLTLWWMVPVHLIGLSTVSLTLSRLRTIAEHQQIGGNQSEFTRSHEKRILEAVFLYDANFNLHAEHHRFPGVQSRALPEVRKELEMRDQNLAPLSSSMVHTIFQMYRALESQRLDDALHY